MGYMAGVCVVAVIGVLVAVDANERGMNGAGWGIGTFLLGIVFLPLYLMVRKPLPADAGTTSIPPGMGMRLSAVLPMGNAGLRSCTTCGRPHPAGSAVCPYCGAGQP